mmetsp:Transcript_23853/g.77736  ORF Transcript_23853/g.77736 Transcript_23853/m.77736 type:complete len:454 (-) Transcript_23853:41-1402(-)
MSVFVCVCVPPSHLALLRLLRLLRGEVQALERAQRGAHLGVGDRQAARARHQRPVDVAADHVHALVRRAELLEQLEGLAQPRAGERRELVEAVLQPGLRVHPPTLVDGRVRLLLEEGRGGEGLDGGEAEAERLPVEVQRSEKGLEGVGEHLAARAAALLLEERVLVPHAAVHPAAHGRADEDRVVDEGGAQESDRLLVALREVVERKVARGEVEQRVAEPLEPLVVQPRVDAASDGAVPERHARRRVPAGAESGGDDGVVDGRVGEGLAEQPKVAKLDAARLLEGGHRRVLLRLRVARCRVGRRVRPAGGGEPRAPERQVAREREDEPREERAAGAEAAVEVDGAEEALQTLHGEALALVGRVGVQRARRRPIAVVQQRREAELKREEREELGADDTATRVAEHALVAPREGCEGVVRGDDAQHGVAERLEARVVRLDGKSQRQIDEAVRLAV